MKRPEIDPAGCNLCGSCVAACPEVFVQENGAAMVQIADMAVYPQDCVDEAIKYCPHDCICWSE